MNFQTMDSLGGLIEGNKARMAEDTTRIEQANVLEQIAKAAQDRQYAEQANPLRLQELGLGVKERNQRIDTGEFDLQAKKAEENRKKVQSYVGQVIQYGNLPGAADGVADELGIPSNHPVRQAAKSAWQASQGWDPKKGPSPIEQLQERLAQGDDKSRQQIAKDDAAFKRETARQDAMTQRTTATNQSRERMATEAAQAKTKAAQIRAEASAAGLPKTFEAYAVKLELAVEQAERNGDAALAATARQKADQVLTTMRMLRTEKDAAAAEARANELYKITDGAIDVRGAGRSAQSGAAAPKPAAQPNSGTTKSGVKYTITPSGGAPAAAKPVAPTSAPGGTNWWDDPNG